MTTALELEIPEISLILLVGTAGSGKSTFARKHFAPTEIVSSDQLRAMIIDDPADQGANDDAFDLLHTLVEKRLSHRRLTVIDATNVEPRSRKILLKLASAQFVGVQAIVFDLPIEVCIQRDAARTERSVGEAVVREHRLHLDGGLARMPKEGFVQIHRLDSVDQANRARVKRVPLPNDLRDQPGPFDIIGDVHGCAEELRSLLSLLGYLEDGTHPDGRRVIFLGDLVDRGPGVAEVLRIAMHMVAERGALCVIGNHEAKLLRWLEGRNVTRSHGLAASIDQLEREPPETLTAIRGFLESMPDHYRLADGRLVVTHAGIRERMIGGVSRKVRAFCLYGDTTGEKDEAGLPIRRDWARLYFGDALIVYGHTPSHEARWVNHTCCIDTGCVFGGKLTALRWPERETYAVDAVRTHYAHV